MDPDASPPGAVATIGVPPAAPVVSPRIVQLFPLPGNVYKSNYFFYNSTANVSQCDFGEVLAFASVHSHPVTVHDCPDIHEFQAAYPLASVCPLSEVPPAILAWGQFPLSKGGCLAPPAMGPLTQIPAPLAVMPLANLTAPSGSVAPNNASDGLHSLLTHHSLGSSTVIRRGDPPFAGIATHASSPPALPVVLDHLP
jgi:hypothetical protein